MDTKSKKSINNQPVRVFAFLLCVALAVGAMIQALLGIIELSRCKFSPFDPDIYSEAKLTETRGFQHKMCSDIYQVGSLHENNAGAVGETDQGMAETRLQELIPNLERDFDLALFYAKFGTPENMGMDDGEWTNLFAQHEYATPYEPGVKDHLLEGSRMEYMGRDRFTWYVFDGSEGGGSGLVFDMNELISNTTAASILLEEVPLKNYLAENYQIGNGRILDTEGEEILPFGEETARGDASLATLTVLKLKSLKIPENYALFQEIYRDELEAFIAREMEERKSGQDHAYADLKSGNVLYYVADGTENIVSNVSLNEQKQIRDPRTFTEAPAWISVENGEVTTNPPSLKNVLYAYGEESYEDSGRFEEKTFYLTYSADVFKKDEADLADARAVVPRNFYPAVGLLLFALLLLVLNVILTGPRLAEGEGRRMCKADKTFVEIQMLLISVCLILPLPITQAFYFQFYENYRDTLSSPQGEPNLILVIGIAVTIFLLFSLGLWCFLSLIRNLKNASFLQRSILFMLLRGVVRILRGFLGALKDSFSRGNVLGRIVLLVCLFWAVMLFFSFLLGVSSASGGTPFVGLFSFLFTLGTLVFSVVFTNKKVKKFNELKKGIEEVSSGNLTWKIAPPSGTPDEIDRLSMKLNDIGQASNAAIQNELKNQRLKTDLISNVSHDLKTPLTSILTYTDLLKKEGLTGEKAEEYLAVVDEKGRQLEKLTEDLFEAAKASSGAIPVRMGKVDLLALISQGIVEKNFGEEGEALEIIIGKDLAEKDHYYVNADGQLLWRVVDNLLTNVQKYALEGSRVYIDLSERLAGPGMRSSVTMLEVKNISRNRLNIPADELMERFKRGDESRATSGSGLGLSIARDLARLQGGSFEIFIDGDLFKATTVLPMWTEANG